MRLIDADALHEALDTKQKWVVRCGDKHNEGYTYDQVHFAIDEAPTIKAVSVNDYRSMVNKYYKLQKTLERLVDYKDEPSFKVDEIEDDDPTIHAIAYLQKVGWLQEHDKALTEPQIESITNCRQMDCSKSCPFKDICIKDDMDCVWK